MDLKILKVISQNQGIKVAEIKQKMINDGDQINENQIRNSIKRKLRGYIEHKGSNKTGGYFIKD